MDDTQQSANTQALRIIHSQEDVSVVTAGNHNTFLSRAMQRFQSR
jgi:hypothetical protein